MKLSAAASQPLDLSPLALTRITTTTRRPFVRHPRISTTTIRSPSVHRTSITTMGWTRRGRNGGRRRQAQDFDKDERLRKLTASRRR
ncbi:hypothetical protein Bca101_067014 [Brassica carinata]